MANKKVVDNWAARMSDSVMKRTPDLNDKWTYEYGVALKGIELVWRKTGNTKYYEYIKKNIDAFVDENGDIRKYKVTEYNIDHVNNGKLFFALYEETGDERYKKAAYLLREQLRNHPRTSEGGFWHKQVYPYQMWLDGIYMGSPFYAEFAKVFGENEILDDVAKQVILCEKHTKDIKTGLLYHAWDEKKEQPWCNKETGCSKNFWGRSVGWYVMAIVDILDYLPENHIQRGRIIEILNEVIEALIKVQDADSGVWYQVLDKGNRKENYLEASASCMIVYAMAKGVRKGYLKENLMPSIKKAYEGIINEFIEVTDEGSVNLNKVCAVAGLGGPNGRDGSFEYYVSEPIKPNDFKGVGAFILASAEVEELDIEKK